MAEMGTPRQDLDTVGQCLRAFESMKAARVDFDTKWQMVSDYILPRRDFSVTARPGQLRPHRVTSSVATNANSHMAAFLLTYMIDVSQPFLKPNINRGLVASGRRTDLSDQSTDYLTDLTWSLYDHAMLPNTRMMLRLGSMLQEFCAFGAGVLWTGRKRGYGPYVNGRPLQACWWSENEEGEIDTLYFRMQLPIYRVIQRWPAAANVDGWNGRSNYPDEQQLTPILICCHPRTGGQVGAVAEHKPFAYCVIAEERKAILEEAGYDSFPYQVFRYDPMPGATYAEGCGVKVLPDVMVLNHLQEAIENCASQKARPPIAVPARMFGRTRIDRRPGAVTEYNPAGIGLQKANEAIIRMDFTGDPTEAQAMCQDLRAEIEAGYFVDWMRPHGPADERQAGVMDRRELRLRGMSSIVANCEQPMGQLGNRFLEILDQEGFLPPAPPEIAGAEVDWEYAGPLAIAQLAGNVQSTLQLMNTAALVAQSDPDAAAAVDLEESLRVIAEGLGVPPKVLKGRTQVAQMRAARALKQKQAEDAQKLQLAAQAGKDAGAGMESMANAAQTVQGGPPGAGAPPGGAAAPAGPPGLGGGPPAPFAPAAPFQPGIAA